MHSSQRELLDKLEICIISWNFHSLNFPNKTVLLKFVLQSLPLYLFSILHPPKLVLKTIKNLQRSFLWGFNSNQNRWALISWKNVCLPKKAGGLGIRDLEINNQSLSSKIWWNWISKNDSPMGESMEYKIWTRDGPNSNDKI